MMCLGYREVGKKKKGGRECENGGHLQLNGRRLVGINLLKGHLCHVVVFPSDGSTL